MERHQRKEMRATKTEKRHYSLLVHIYIYWHVCTFDAPVRLQSINIRMSPSASTFAAAAPEG